MNAQKWLREQRYQYSPLTSNDSPSRGRRVRINHGRYTGFIGYIAECKFDSWYTVTVPLSAETGEGGLGFFNISDGELDAADRLFD